MRRGLSLITWPFQRLAARALGGQREGFIPYLVGKIDLAGGPRVAGVVCGDPDPTIGMSVRLCLVS
ncbi:MAG: OB-fold domain-containing protein, partial [Chloroflexi bacterium]|nr:OB-fold domain-containing protein [Chloroflexota bacterium]